ncbi:potassium channel subfamily U member 1 [Rhineura floridana]|uniref:potassium channel subfamily U member 1 n=1 Tax=Rhineura floridana TaxID=261503 RepID=UPI002AC893E2|nr:potassium channel subfamily U member 1 [Rhineura floridana]
MFSPNLDYSWVEEVESHCTEYVQLAFITSCLSIFVGGILIILMFRVFEYMLHFCFFEWVTEFKLFTQRMPMLSRWKGHFQNWVVMMISAQTTVGRVLVMLVFLFSIGSLIIYFINCNSVKQFCLSFDDQTVLIDLFFNLFFLVYFGLRFLAASDKLTFWLELNSIVDFFTITPVWVSFYLERKWLGLRFLRALRLMELPKILQFLQITRTATAIKLSKLLAVFISTWLTAAGFLHWMENSGDPWVQHRNSQNLTYFECLYLIMVTMSTVGYGDVVVKTTLGRVFILFFIVGGLILFANLVPEMVDIVGSTKIYKGSYASVKGRKYIVVCGDITLNSVTAFLRDFLSQTTGEVTEIIFLGENPPCLELETIFRCYAAHTSFFQGTVMKTQDLLRVQMENAEACLILADTCSAQPYIEDTSNIMRVLSIKNHFPTTRVIIQIIQSSNKVYLPKLPNWDWRRGDSIICFAELKLGLIAQSCLVPGLTTLLTSLFIREDSQLQKLNIRIRHQHEIEGQDYKVMTQLLSNDFMDMSFREASRLCFVKLDLILLAIEFRSGVQGNSILINPTSVIKLHFNTMGFFIAKTAKELRRARYYCKQCHSDIATPDLIEKCHCKGKSSKKSSLVAASDKMKALQDYLAHPVGSLSLGIFPLSSMNVDNDSRMQSNSPFHWAGVSWMLWSPGSTGRPSAAAEPWHDQEAADATGDPSESASLVDGGPPEILEDEYSETSLDSTGMFHWCEAVPFEQALLKRNKRFSSDLHDHIVVCVFGDATSTLIGLRNFVMPLRASHFTFSELKDIVFVGSLEYLQREWEFIQNFPKLYLLKGSALSCADLKTSNIKHCAMCAILSAHARGAGDQTLVDTKSILATLNILSLQFKLSPSTAEANTRRISQETIGNQSLRIFAKRIPIITELKIASNAQFFEQSNVNESDYPGQTPEHLSRGEIFSDSFLDSLLCTTYHNHHVLALLQTLVTGGTSPELEEYLAEETSLSGSASNVMHFGPRNRCKLALLALTDSPATVEGLLLCFGDVYTRALDMFGILCFGLYRLKEEPNPNENRKVYCKLKLPHRYVIARPPTSLEIFSSDQLFCLVPFNTLLNDLTAVVKSIPPFKRKIALQKQETRYNKIKLKAFHLFWHTKEEEKKGRAQGSLSLILVEGNHGELNH